MIFISGMLNFFKVKPDSARFCSILKNAFFDKAVTFEPLSIRANTGMLWIKTVDMGRETDF